jgi:hypothetical protein
VDCFGWEAKNSLENLAKIAGVILIVRGVIEDRYQLACTTR